MGHSYIYASVTHASELTGLGTEQISFVTCILMSFIAAFVLRHGFSPKTTSVQTRLLLSGCFGVWLLFFSWGWKVLIPLTDTVVTFLLLKYLDPKYAHKVTFLLSMGFLFSCHLHHLYNFHKVGRRYSTDFTGPNMILTQRITSLAFNIHDGLHKKAVDLNEDQKRYAVKKFPTFLEYFSYNFMFMSVVAGPFVFFEDYMSFIRGTNYTSKSGEKTTDPPYLPTTARKFAVGVIMAAIFVYGSKVFPYLKNVDEEFLKNSGWLHKIFYMYISLLICRTKYYIAWSLADGVCNTAGLGFNGYDENGKPKWNMVSNINIIAIETSTSAKVYIDNWNIMTGQWLRRVCYDRAPPKYRMLMTFLLSACWHGFFPGYYMTFLSGHIITLAQRKVRHSIRPLFQTSTERKAVYEVITWFATQLAISYIVIPFVILEFNGSFEFYKSCYFFGHVISFFLFFALPKSKRTRAESSREEKKILSNGTSQKNHYIGNGESNGHAKEHNGHAKKHNGIMSDKNGNGVTHKAVNGVDQLRHR